MGDGALAVATRHIVAVEVVARHAECQEIGLVTFMFSFEFLFSYVPLAISFYGSFTNLFSIILFLICQLPKTLKTKEMLKVLQMGERN